ncbi:MAG: phosphatidate cytidylyltransferase [Ruminococcaceae bacterium]|nr:phosphatidate cytidylyltransferase [Oscillospiraceae bacterium]
MKQRVISALIISAIAIVAIILGGIVFDIAILLMATIGLYEFYGAFAKKGHSPIRIFGLVYIGLLALMIFLDSKSYLSIILETKSNVTIDLFPPIFILHFLLLLSFVVFKFEKYTPFDVAVTIFGGFYVVALLSYFINLRNLSGGMYLFIIPLVGAIATDTFALFAGKQFGKKKLIPAVSPNKTVAGSIGGFCGSIIILTIGGMVLVFGGFYTDMPIYHYPILGAIIGITAQIGDLAASSIKRYTGIKDFGKLIPGHGGILDRIDSYIFTIPVVYYYLLLFGIGGV